MFDPELVGDCGVICGVVEGSSFGESPGVEGGVDLEEADVGVVGVGSWVPSGFTIDDSESPLTAPCRVEGRADDSSEIPKISSASAWDRGRGWQRGHRGWRDI